MKKVHVITLGCRTNLFDSEFIKSNLKLKGMEETDNLREADYIIINSCAVTKKAERDSRKALNRALRERKEGAQVIFTGCVASIKRIGKADFEGTHRDVLKLFDIPPEEAILRDYTSRTRATLKVQEGCNFQCSYCIIRRARGPSRSRPLHVLMRELEILRSRGFREVMITGIQVGDWGREWGLDLPYLLQEMVKRYPDMMFRLSSILPAHVTDRLVNLYEKYPRNLLPHMHISLQSASNRVLRDMRRPYTIEFYERTVMKLLERVEDMSVGTDIIVGFPTETDEDFMETYRFVERFPFSYVHVFEYSPREGTPAAEMKPAFPDRVKKERVRSLVELARSRTRAFYGRYVGKEIPVLVEQRKGDYWHGTSHNYIKVRFRSGEDLRGKLVRFRGARVGGDSRSPVLEGDVVGVDS